MSLVDNFMNLFQGYDEAFGTGEGRWIDRPPVKSDFASHLSGGGPGIGIGPLRRDGTISFAAIDLDEPDFASAREMQEFLPGPAYIERSRSGNAHVWVFFDALIEAWVVRGVMKEAILAAGKADVEIFPKHDEWYPGLKRGNYINLPYHGNSRPVFDTDNCLLSVQRFLEVVELNEPDEWRKKARWLLVTPPSERVRSESTFGDRAQLHICAEHIIANREESPVVEGHRHVVYFNLSKMLLNYEGFDEDEAWYFLTLVNASSPDPMSERELRRQFDNAHKGQWTSTGCDDPIMSPYVHPDCPIIRKVLS